MYINFGGGGLLGFGVIASFKFDQISHSYHGLCMQSMVVKKFYCLEWAQKFYAFRG